MDDKLESAYEFHLGDPAKGIKVENKGLGLTMSVVPNWAGPGRTDSVEVIFFDSKGKDVAGRRFYSDDLGIDTNDAGFWEEFGDRYARRFAGLEKINKRKIVEGVFPDIMERT